MDSRHKMYIFILTVSIIFVLQELAFSAERSVIVGFHQKPGPSEKALIHGANGIIKRTYDLIPAVAASLPEQAIAHIKKSKRVAYVEDDGIFTAVEPLPGDEYTNAWGVRHINAELAHSSGNKGAGIKVAVIDTGIDYAHEDLNDNYSGGYDFVFNDDDPFDDSWNSHGTHIAGVIGAEQNGTGVVGVAPEAGLYAVKVLDGGGFGLLSWIIAGIEWSVNNGMDIVNLSLQGNDFQSLKDACDNAYNAGTIIIAAGGNTYGGGVMYPAAYDSVIAVTATNTYDMPAYFSPAGPEVELAAPGMNILSTVSGGGYALLSGTSQAAPHAAGTAALFLSSELEDINIDGIIDHEDVRQVLRMTATDMGYPGTDDIYGYGLVDATEAALPAGPPAPILISRTPGPPMNDSVTVRISGTTYEIKIENNGLSLIKADLLKDSVKQKDISFSYRFDNEDIHDIIFYIDSGTTDLDITFTPFGKPGTSANILFNTEEGGK